VRRRHLLASATGTLLATVAGCLDGDSGADPTDEGDGATATGTLTTTSNPTATTTDGLDLREANVTGVDVEARDEGYRFSVTLYHDDDGEDGYANWWQVETLDDRRLGRRELTHAHGTREFTRSETVSIPAAVDCVVVRGHDQTHEYGGQAALVTLESGTSRLVRQGSEPTAFETDDCPK
jgi:hypothetical protein